MLVPDRSQLRSLHLLCPRNFGVFLDDFAIAPSIEMEQQLLAVAYT